MNRDERAAVEGRTSVKEAIFLNKGGFTKATNLLSPVFVEAFLYIVLMLNPEKMR